MLKSFMLATFVLLAASGIYAGSVSSTVSLSEAEASKLMGADLPNIGSCQGSKTCDQCVAGNCYEDGVTGMCWGFYWWYGSSEVAHPYCPTAKYGGTGSVADALAETMLIPRVTQACRVLLAIAMRRRSRHCFANVRTDRTLCIAILS